MKLRIATLCALLALGACKGDRGPAGPAGPPSDVVMDGGSGTDGGSATDGGSGTDGGSTPGTAGFTYQIQAATLTAAAAPTVTFKVTDPAGNAVTNLVSGGALAWTPNFTLAKREANGKFTSYLTRQVSGKPWIDSAGTTHPPAVAAPTTVTQAVSESATAARIAGGTGGVYTYTFAAPVATGLDTAATTRIGMYGNRTVNGEVQSASNTFDFVPAGGAVTGEDLISDAQCNVCHGVVRAHGDQRLGVKLCLTCHTPQTIDPETNGSVDMAVLVHKIHTGKAVSNSQGVPYSTGTNNGAPVTPHPMLGTAGYTVVGYGPNNPATFPASSTFEYSKHAAMGPSHTTYFETTTAGTGTGANVAVSDPGIARNCALCHGTANAAAVQGDVHMTIQACSQCHGFINPATGAGHPAFTPSNGTCAACHGAAGIQPEVRGHSEGWESAHNLDFGTMRHTITVKIDDARNVIAGQAPALDFTVTVDGQPYDLLTKPLGTLGFQMAGPAAVGGQQADYAEVIPTTPAPAGTPAGATSPGVVSALLGTGTNGLFLADPAKVVAKAGGQPGQFTFTFPLANVIPAGRTGTYVFAYEAYYKDVKAAVNGDQVSKPYAALPVFHGANKNVQYREVQPAGTTGPANVAGSERRVVVSNEKCNTCHEQIGFHSNRSRLGPDYCATCHNDNLANTGRFRFLRAAGEGGKSVLAPSVGMNVFIHKIHMGAELTNPYYLGSNRTATSGGPGAEGLSNFSYFDSPSPNVKCATCHEGQSYGLTTAVNQLPVRMTRFTCGPATANDATVAAGGADPAGVYCGDRIPEAVYVPHNTAVCGSCHDSPAAQAHMQVNTVFASGQTATAYNPYTAGALDPTKVAVETCATCHSAGKEADALVVHQPPAFLVGSR